MSITINCFGLGSNVTNYIQSQIGSKYNLVSNPLHVTIQSDTVNPREYMHEIGDAMKKKFCSPTIVGINSVEVDDVTGYPGAFINTIKSRNKLKAFSRTFNGKKGSLRFCLLFFNSKMDHYYFSQSTRGIICTSDKEDICDKFSPDLGDSCDIIKQPLFKLSDFLKNRYILPVRSGYDYNNIKGDESKVKSSQCVQPAHENHSAHSAHSNHPQSKSRFPYPSQNDEGKSKPNTPQNPHDTKNRKIQFKSHVSQSSHSSQDKKVQLNQYTPPNAVYFPSIIK